MKENRLHPHPRPYSHPHHHLHHLNDSINPAELLSDDAMSLLQQFFAEQEDADWAIRTMLNDGPYDKTVRKALILQSLGNLLKILKDQFNIEPYYQPGSVVVSSHHKEPLFTYQLEIPEVLFAGLPDKDSFLKHLGAGICHDVIADLFTLNVIAFLTEVLSNLNKIKDHETAS